MSTDFDLAVTQFEKLAAAAKEIRDTRTKMADEQADHRKRLSAVESEIARQTSEVSSLGRTLGDLKQQITDQTQARDALLKEVADLHERRVSEDAKFRTAREQLEAIRISIGR